MQEQARLIGALIDIPIVPGTLRLAVLAQGRLKN